MARFTVAWGPERAKVQGNLPQTDRCVIEGCRTKPKAGPLCGRHSKYADPQGPDTIKELSHEGWAFVMDEVAKAAKVPKQLPAEFLIRAVNGQAAVSRKDSLTLLSFPGWGRRRLYAPYFAAELATALSDPSRPIEDRLAAADASRWQVLDEEGYSRLATDPEPSVRHRLATGILPEGVRDMLYGDSDPTVVLAALRMHFRQHLDGVGMPYAISPLLFSPRARKKVAEVMSGQLDFGLYNVLPLSDFTNIQFAMYRDTRPQIRGYLAYWASSIAVFDTAMSLLEGWTLSLDQLLQSAESLT